MSIYKGSQKIKDVYTLAQNTNCLLNIPQDINLELNNGTLTLKAGSKVYVPNGFEKTKKYYKDVVTTKYWKEITTGSKELVYAAYSWFGNIKYAMAPLGTNKDVYDNKGNVISAGGWGNITESEAEYYAFGSYDTCPRSYENDIYIDTTVTETVEGTPEDYTYTTEETVTTEVGADDDWNRVEEVDTDVKKFDEVVTSSDTTLARNSSAKYFSFLKNNGAAPDTMRVDYCYSGTTAPTVNHTYAMWYDTTNNKIKWTNDNGSTWTDGYSFPIAIISNDTQGTINASSIDQVFNGFGYIGSTVYALPNVKGLIPDGWNEDGTLRSIEFTVDKVLTTTNSLRDEPNTFGIRDNGSILQYTYLGEYAVPPTPSGTWGLYYNTQEQVFYYNNAGKWEKRQIYLCGKVVYISLSITSFTPKSVEGYTKKARILTTYKTGKRKYYKYSTEPNATINGTFARLDKGVASGFTSANYLKLSEVFNPQSNSWEALFKVKINTLINGSQIILGQRNSGGYNFYVDVNTVRLSVGDTSFTGTTTLQENTTYWFKYIFTGDTYIIKSSTNGVEWIDEVNTASTITATPTSDDCRIGVWYNTYSSGLGNPFLGSIDLNESYININGELWWSGDEYTKVGSWIDDGIVGEFTSSNYLKTLQMFNPSSNTWEWNIKFTMGSDTTTTFYTFGCTNTSGYHGALLGMVNGSLRCWLSSNGTSWNIVSDGTAATPLNADQTYYVKFGWSGTEYYIDLSEDGIEYKRDYTLASTTAVHSSDFNIGAAWDLTVPFKGSIDFNQSYININGKDWWHGTKAYEVNLGGEDVYEDWTQPVLSANGTMGGDKFAVRGERTSSQPAYYAYDGNGSTYLQLWSIDNNETYFYNPNPLKVSKLDFVYYPETWITSGEIYGSNDDSNYILLTTFSHSTNSGTVAVNNEVGYKYFKIKVLGANGSTGSQRVIADIYTLTITAQELVAIGGTIDDADYSLVEPQLVYNLKYNLNSSSAYAKEGTVSGTNRFGTDTGATTSENLNQTSIFTFNTPAPAGKWTGSFQYYSQVNFSMNQVYWRLTYEDGTQEYAYGPTGLGDTAYGGGERATISISFTAKKPIKAVTVYAQGSGGGSGRYGGLEYIQMFFDGTKQ